MKHPYEVLQQKEVQLARVRREIESLRLVATLLSDGSSEDLTKKPVSADKPLLKDSEATGTGGLFSSISASWLSR